MSSTATPDIDPARWQSLWQAVGDAPAVARLPRDHAVLFVRGLFGAWIPRHLAAPLAALRDRGMAARIAATSPRGTLAANAQRIGAELDALIAHCQRVWLLTHSKAGVAALLALAAEPRRWQALAGWASVQMPCHGAPLLDSLFDPAHAAERQGAERWREPVEAALLRALGASGSCSELTRARLPDIVQPALDAVPKQGRAPWLAVATHAQAFTGALDLRHSHFARRFPGEPHDGVFLARDQRWPAANAQLVLPHIDHSQPSVGGLGFDHARFWLTLLALLNSLRP
ncbi:hypothetical protein [Ottowia testudinis]|uniref:Alpha/beta hydrolase n=1 Tax=Ottowia testudinis TaxID=2816950 RepID=A0A975H3Z2_9BURK|nr:hypothetical protein [Ottowia testudinis]QTD45781.1 hypothetical protein J1M35_02345 [Ottowia testudinis]